MRILYCHATFAAPPQNIEADRFFLLSRELEGDVLQPVWYRSPEEVIEKFGPGSYPVYTVGRFRYHWFLGWKHTGLRRKLGTLWFYISTGWRLHREKPFDCIVAYSHMTTALCGAVLKLLTGSGLVPEIATSPELVYLVNRSQPNRLDRLMHLYSDACLHLMLWASDRLHLLYAWQLSAYRAANAARVSVFHEFVAVSSVPRRRENTERYILLVGAPWHLKGADVLIEAFGRLAADFPDVKLKLLGHYPELNARDFGPRIEVMKARSNPETLEIIAGAAIFALPSRCEGLPRVILEAMAAGVPVVASKVGGISHLVRHGVNGYVVPPEDTSALEQRLRELLSDPELRTRMGNAGYEIAHSEFTEDAYVAQFARMVREASGRAR